jgi:hypothetical protein
MTDTDPIKMALPLTVYAVNVRYNVKDHWAEAAGPGNQVLFVLHQFARAGLDPLTAEQALEVAKESIEADAVTGVAAVQNLTVGEMYEFGDNWSVMTQHVLPSPCQRCLTRTTDVKVR